MFHLVVIISFPDDTHPHDLLECDEGIIWLVVMYMLKALLDHWNQLVYVSWVPGVLEALD